MASHTLPVSLLCQPAREQVPSRASITHLNCLLVTTLRIGTAPVTFRPPGYDSLAIKIARPQRRFYALPTSVARRLERFVFKYFIDGPIEPYSDADFVNYVAGTALSVDDAMHIPAGAMFTGAHVQPGMPYGITDHQRLLAPVIGLDDGHVLLVNSQNGAICLVHIRDLMRAHKATGLLLLSTAES